METINTTSMNADELAAFQLKRESEDRKIAKLESKQDKNKRTRRTKAQMLADRAPGKRGIVGDDCIDVVSVRRVGIDNDEMSDADEVISLPKDIARNLQKSGAVRVEI